MTPQLLTVIKAEKLKDWGTEEWQNWYVEPKYDGARLIYHEGRFQSRTGKPFHNLDHIASAISKIPELRGLTLDGEVYGENWAETMSVARSSKTSRDGSTLRYAVFDVMHHQDWADKRCRPRLNSRRQYLQVVMSPLMYKGSGYFVHATPISICRDYEDFEKAHEAHLHLGCDGTVLKRVDSLYEFKRTKTWLKVKPVDTFDCRVVGWKAGTGKYAGLLGALELLPEDGGGITSFCSGMTDEQRELWARCPDVIVSKTVEVKARGVHKSGRLIEPRFIRIREDK